MSDSDKKAESGEKTTKVDRNNSRVFIGGIASGQNEEDIKTIMQQYGEITSVSIIRDRNGRSKGYGFVSFRTYTEAVKAVAGHAEENKITVRFAYPKRASVPSRDARSDQKGESAKDDGSRKRRLIRELIDIAVKDLLVSPPRKRGSRGKGRD